MSNWQMTVSTESDRHHCPAIFHYFARHSSVPTSKENGMLYFSHILYLKTYLNPKYQFLDIDGLLKLLILTMTVCRSDNPTEIVDV